MRTTSRRISGLKFHGITIHTRIELLGEPSGGTEYGHTAMVWRAETDAGGVFCIYREAGSQRYRRREWISFQTLAKDAATATQAKREVEKNSKHKRQDATNSSMRSSTR